MSRVIAEVIQTILKHGRASTSFIASYPGFEYFVWGKDDSAVTIAYLNTVTAWVAASEPIGPETHCLEAFAEFIKAAKAIGKIIVLLPASSHFTERAKSLGVSAIQIGEEPWYRTENFQFQKIAKQAIARGAHVEAFDPATLSGREKIELESVTEAWLESRKSAPLEFLNQVKPWVHLSHKKYFRVKISDRQVAYLSAIPIPALNSWYLIDLIRAPSSPLGTAELLISRAVQVLSLGGCSVFTLGMSPMIPVKNPERSKHPFIYAVFQYIFDHLNLAYNFKSLYQFKMKMRPDYWEPQFLLTTEKGLGIRTTVGLAKAVYPKGMVKSTAVTAAKIIRSQFLKPNISQLLSNDLVPRGYPNGVLEFCSRLRITLGIAAANILVFFFSTTGDLVLRETAEKRFEYSVERFLTNGINSGDIRALFLHSFIHWNLLHLATNLVTLLFLVGFLEIIAGSSIVLIGYTVGILFSNPLTSAILIPPLALLNANWANFFVHEVDVGCSLGIFTCLGILAHFLKRPRLFLAILSFGTLIVAICTSSILSLDHLTACALGYGIGKYYVRKS